MTQKNLSLILIGIILVLTAVLIATKVQAPKNKPAQVPRAVPSNNISENRNADPSDESADQSETITGNNNHDGDADIATIKKYYTYLTEGNLEKAYDMYWDQSKITFQKYQSWYKDAVSATPDSFSELGVGTYQFTVYYQEKDQPESEYQVVMAVKDDKIKTLSSRQVSTDFISGPPNDKFGKYEAFVRKKGNMNYMILTDDGKELIIDQSVADYDADFNNIPEGLVFMNPKFSPTGDYLSYDAGGWEGGWLRVYDVKKKKMIIETDSPETFGFTKDDRFIFDCISPGMAGGAGQIFSLSSGKLLYDVYEHPAYQNFSSIECQYDRSANKVVFSLSEPYGSDGEIIPSQRKVEYDLDTGKVK